MSRILKKAELELELAGLLSQESDFYGGSTGKAVLELLEVFSKQGHSGMSAGIVVDIFKKLANHETLTPITGLDIEWGDKEDYGDGPYQQNKRESGLFKYADGRVNYVSALVKRTQNGGTWSGPLYMNREDAINNTNSIRSSLQIKGFPFVPKTFYIDVIEEEVAKDDWIMYVKDANQLNDVWDYYVKPDFLK